MSSADILRETGDDIKKFVETFVQTYISTLVGNKINGVIEGVLAEVGIGKGDKLSEEDKNDESPLITSGLAIGGWKRAWGPERTWNAYYDVAAFAIRENDSVISRTTTRYSELLALLNELKRDPVTKPDVGRHAWPSKKIFSKRDWTFYRERVLGIQSYFQFINHQTQGTIASHPAFLKFFKLMDDPEGDDQRDLFLGALQAVAEKNNVNWEWAVNRASWIGVEEKESEMLKVVAVEMVGDDACRRLRGTISPSIPDYFRSRMLVKADQKMNGFISTTVSNGWNAGKGSFNAATKKLDKALEEALDPLKKLLLSVIKPMQALIAEKTGLKLGDVDDKPKNDDDDDDKDNENENEDGDDGPDEKEESPAKKKKKKGPKMRIRQFEAIANALDAITDTDTRVTRILSECQSKISHLSHTHLYSGYIHYVCMDNEIVDTIGSIFSSIDKILERHQKLSIGLVNLAYVLSRAFVKSLEPFAKLVDSLAMSDEKEFDPKDIEKRITQTCNDAGVILAKEWFHLPSTLWRISWHCGPNVTKQVLKFARQSVSQIGDILGRITKNYRPMRREDARQGFVDILESELDDFISNRVVKMQALVRKCTKQVIADLFKKALDDGIGKMVKELGIHDLLSKLPDPIGSMDPLEMVSPMAIGILVNLGTSKLIKKWAEPTEQMLLKYPDGGEPDGLTEDALRKLVGNIKVKVASDDITQEGKQEEIKKDGGGDSKDEKDSEDEKSEPIAQEAAVAAANDNNPGDDSEKSAEEETEGDNGNEEEKEVNGLVESTQEDEAPPVVEEEEENTDKQGTPGADFATGMNDEEEAGDEESPEMEEELVVNEEEEDEAGEVPPATEEENPVEEETEANGDEEDGDEGDGEVVEEEEERLPSEEAPAEPSSE